MAYQSQLGPERASCNHAERLHFHLTVQDELRASGPLQPTAVYNAGVVLGGQSSDSGLTGLQPRDSE